MSEADQYHDDHDDDQDQDKRAHGRGVPGPVDLETENAALRAELDAANALGAETTAQLKTARYHLDVMLKEGEAAEAERDDLRARIDAALDALDDLPSFAVKACQLVRAALAEPVGVPEPPNPEPAPCANPECVNGWPDFRRGDAPCPSCSASPAPCATCGDQREVCRLCGPMPRGATCLDHHHDEGIPCPSCSASPGGEAP